MTHPLVLATRRYARLVEDIRVAGAFDPGEVETRTFPDGELYLRLRTDVDGRDDVTPF